MKYYGISNAARLIQLPSGPVQFDAAEFFTPTNSWYGTYQSEKSEDIAELDAQAIKGVIEVLTEDQYLRFDAKKKQLQPGWPHYSLSQPKLQQQLSPKEIAEAVAGGPVEPVKVEKLDDVIAVKPSAKAKK